MIEVDEAVRIMLAQIEQRGLVGLPLIEAVGCFAGREILATIALPRFDNSAMDGYAVRAGDAVRGARLTVSTEQPAGVDLGLQVGPGEAIRVFTGACIPSGADAVVMQEDMRPEGEGIVILDDVSQGQFIRRAGSDVCQGQVLLRAGDRVSPAAVGLLASQGRVQVDVVARPKVGVLSTGDELVAPGSALLPGQIFNSNAPMLQALLAESGVNEVVASHAKDSLTDTVSSLRGLLDSCHVVIVSGGVSVGDHDLVKPALEALGFHIDLWKVRMKPGKPFLFAQGKVAGQKRSVIGLPGNPVSSYVTFQVLVRPVLAKMSGNRSPLAASVSATLGEGVANEGDRPQYVRGELIDGVFTPVGLQRSDALFGLSRGCALLRVEVGESVAVGDLRSVIV